MRTSARQPCDNALRLLSLAASVVAITLGTAQLARAASPAPVNLGAAAPFVILTKTGITNVPTSDITGNLGVSPIAATAITGFSLVLDGSNRFSRSTQVTGRVYAASYASPTPSMLTTAVHDMETAYTNAAGRALPDHVDLYAGNLSGRTLAPGLYKWNTGVLITTSVTLAGARDAVWVFQIAGNLTLGSGADVLLSGGAQAKNIFWQVGGGVGVEIGTTAHVEGTILAKKAIHLRTGASLNGRALAQTAVTLAQNRIVIPPLNRRQVFTSAAAADGWVLESAENSGRGGSKNAAAATLRLGDNAANKQYRAILQFNTSSLPDGVVITAATLRIRQQGLVGANPFDTHGSLLVDMRTPYFGSAASLQVGDFQAAAGRWAVAAFGATPVGGWRSAALNAAGRARVSRTGTTQFRLRFAAGDDNDFAADYLQFSSGNAGAALRPQLSVTYYQP
ncbi:MAG TPA: ice-binding family protein [Candidatus Methanoperedens sp.]|nr:ice-binding family protein [Candidatus Methanoperedens sp.]